MDFKVNDIIRLVTARYGISPADPVWNEQGKKTCGCVTAVVEGDMEPIKVKWNNGRINSYVENDLGHVEYEWNEEENE